MNLNGFNWDILVQLTQWYSFGMIPVITYLAVRMSWDAVALERLDDQAFYAWRLKTYGIHMLGYVFILFVFTFLIDRGGVWRLEKTLSPAWYFGMHALIAGCYGGAMWIYYVYPAWRVAKAAKVR